MAYADPEVRKKHYREYAHTEHRKAWQKEWHKANPEKATQYRKKKIELHRDKVNEQKKANYYKHRDEIRERLRIKYKEKKSEILAANAKWREENKEKLKILRKCPDQVYNQRKGNAKRRSLIFRITKEEFMEFWNTSCGYCGSKVNGVCLDRVDNTKGYIMGNVVQCCKWCNVMKLDKTVKEFLDHCRKVVAKNENK